MGISIQLPLDAGFLRRECSRCERHFKWHHGPTDDRPSDGTDPDVYWCPYCGETAPPDNWRTAEQVEYIRASAVGPVVREAAHEFNRSQRSSKNSFFKLSISYDEPEPPQAMHEPSDMALVQSPCHPWEPIKVADDWRAPLYCIVCGLVFAVS